MATKKETTSVVNLPELKLETFKLKIGQARYGAAEPGVVRLGGARQGLAGEVKNFWRVK